jgi:hypothetical protein
MKKLLTIATAALGFAALAGTADAQSLIQRQQQELMPMEKTWQRQSIPAGIQKEPLRPITQRDSGADSVSLSVKDVNFNVVGDIGFHVIDLVVRLEPVRPGEPIVFDDPRQFRINVQRGKVVVPVSSLDALFNEHVLAYWPRPLDDMSFRPEEGYLWADGGLKLWSWFPGIWLPAELGGNITLSEDNKLVYDPQDVAALGIPLGGLLRALGIPLDWLLSIDREGAKLDGSLLVLDHRSVFPPPEIAGNLSSAKVTPDGLELEFADNMEAAFEAPPLNRSSYLWIQSGDPKLFDIVVNNARVQVVNDREDERLTFNLYDYRKQVAAGVLNMKKDGTIIATIPSYERVVPGDGKQANYSRRVKEPGYVPQQPLF